MIPESNSLDAAPADRRRMGWITEAALYGFFLLLTTAYTYPLILSAGSSLRCMNDPFLFTWVLNWVAETVFTNPLQLFETPIFFPYGNTLAYSEPLIVPALLLAAPIRFAGGNPVLAYNLTLLASQALCGWAACFATRRITGSMAGGLLAGIAFAFCPFRTGYYNFLIVHLTFAVPLALLYYVRFLETQRPRYMAITVFWVWVQTATIWYGGVPLALLLTTITLLYAVLRPIQWRVRTLLHAAGWVLLLVLTLMPVLWPYLQVRAELGMERSLDELHRFQADILSYFDAGKDHNFYRLADSGRYPGLFAGFTVYVLAIAAFLRRRDPSNHSPHGIQRIRCAVSLCTLSLSCAIAVIIVAGLCSNACAVNSAVSCLGVLSHGLLVVGLVGLAMTGLDCRQSALPDRKLGLMDWAPILGWLTLLFVLITLGPALELGGRNAGNGVYALVYRLFPPLKSIRILIRLAYIPILLLGMLAAFGLANIGRWIPSNRRMLLYLAPALLALEYVSFPLPYDETVDWCNPPPEYQWLASQPDDVAVMEWPSYHEPIDSTYVIWSLYHRKSLVTGVSGFFPEYTRRIVNALRNPDAEAVALLRAVHRLRYLIVHLERLPSRQERMVWEGYSALPPAGLALEEQFGDALVFRILRSPETTATKWERILATRDLKQHSRAALTLSGSTGPGTSIFAIIAFNGHPLSRIELTADDQSYAFALQPPFYKADVNRFTVITGYRVNVTEQTASLYQVGNTGVRSSADIVLHSAGLPYGNKASLTVNGIDYASPRRGYSIIAISAAGEAQQAAVMFDPLVSELESQRLADWIRGIPSGTVVAGVLCDAGLAALTEDALSALESLGIARPETREFRDSHAFVGVTGAKPGSAIQQSGQRAVEIVVGVKRQPDLSISEFELRGE